MSDNVYRHDLNKNTHIRQSPLPLPPGIFTCLVKIEFLQKIISTLRRAQDWQRIAIGEQQQFSVEYPQGNRYHGWK